MPFFDNIWSWFSYGQPFVFNSVAFFALFLLFYGIYTLATGTIQLRNILLVSFSLFFYYKVAGWFVLLLVVIAAIDWGNGLAIFKTPSARGKKAWMLLSLFINLGSLC